MAENGRQSVRRELVAKDQVGMAQANPRNLHQYFASTRPLDADRLDREVTLGNAGNRRHSLCHMQSLLVSNLTSLQPALFSCLVDGKGLCSQTTDFCIVHLAVRRAWHDVDAQQMARCLVMREFAADMLDQACRIGRNARL
jgi:hypothetical protein